MNEHRKYPPNQSEHSTSVQSFQPSIRFTLSEPPGKMSNILPPKINWQTQQAQNSRQSPKNAKRSIIPTPRHKGTCSITRSKRNKPSKSTNDNQQWPRTPGITIQQVCNRHNIRTHKAEIISRHRPHIYKPVILLRMRCTLSIKYRSKASNYNGENERNKPSLWLVHAVVPLCAPADQ